MKWDAPAPVIGAWVAEMDFATAPPVRQVLHQAIEDNLLGYRPTGLDQAALDAMRGFQAEVFDWHLQADQVLLAPDVLSVMGALIQCTDPGSPVVVPTPAYMPFLTIPEHLGHPVIQVPSTRNQEGRWLLNLPAIEQAFAQGAQTFILCNPWNPVGQCLREDELLRLAELIEGHPKVRVFSDEIHSPLAWGAPHLPFLKVAPQLSSQVVTATAASKGWNIAGLHCAQYVALDSALRAQVRQQLGFLEHQVLNLGLMAATAAYNDSRPWLHAVHGQIRANVERVRAWAAENSARVALAGAPGVDDDKVFRISLPEATYLSWWETPAGTLGEVPADTLREAGLRVNPGKDLGRGCEQAFRLNLACSPQTLEEILEILRGQL